MKAFNWSLITECSSVADVINKNKNCIQERTQKMASVMKV